jgi:3-deoxy-manno-octulosonate cytidylyltransferase (CMP-KDO synthetase)
MRFIGIIPARYASSRFPGKPLTLIDGISMIERVYSNATQCAALNEVFVATDDKRIFEHVNGFRGKVVMTSDKHRSGTERCAEAAGIILPSEKSKDDTIIINIQGDEPFLQSSQIELLCTAFTSEKARIASLRKIIEDADELSDPNVVKLVCNKDDEAMYFSRQPIPFLRKHKPEEWMSYQKYYKHIGIYAYRMPVLEELVKLPPCPPEEAESLEQLRWLYAGYSIHMLLTEKESIGIDSPADLSKLTNKT